MKIGINALQVRADKSGVGQYIECLIDGLLHELATDDELLVYATPLNAKNFQRDDARLTVREFGPSARREWRLAYEWINLPGQIKRDRLDVFHGASNFLPRRCPFPSVVTIHDASRWVDPGRYTRANLVYSRLMTRHTLRMNSPVITVSNAAKRDLMRYLHLPEERIHVIHEAAHPRFRLISSDTAPLNLSMPYLLHVGTIEPGKNIERLIHAFAQFRAHHPKHTLVLAGDRGWKMERIFDAIAKHRLENAVRYVGHVSDDELVALYNGAEFFIFPSLNEGFGLPPLEALQCGTSVIASNRSSLPEVLGDAPLYIDPTDISQMAEAMAKVADDSTLRMEMKKSGLAQATRYSWAQTARHTIEVYRMAITARGY